MCWVISGKVRFDEPTWRIQTATSANPESPLCGVGQIQDRLGPHLLKKAAPGKTRTTSKTRPLLSQLTCLTRRMPLSPAAQEPGTSTAEGKACWKYLLCSCTLHLVTLPQSSLLQPPLSPPCSPLFPCHRRWCTQHGLLVLAAWHHLGQSASVTPSGKGMAA